MREKDQNSVQERFNIWNSPDLLKAKKEAQEEAVKTLLRGGKVTYKVVYNMETISTTTVQMTAEQLAKYQEFQEREERKKAKELRKQQLEVYKDLMDTTVKENMPKLIELSERIKELKREIFENFRAVYEMKRDVLNLRKEKQFSDTYTTRAGNKRIILGHNYRDTYDDTASEGVEMVKEYIDKIEVDDKTRHIVKALVKLLSKNSKEEFQFSRVLDLDTLARESGDERFIEGVEIIKRSHRQMPTSTYIKAEYKNSNGAWVGVPLSTTDNDKTPMEEIEEEKEVQDDVL